MSEMAMRIRFMVMVGTALIAVLAFSGVAWAAANPLALTMTVPSSGATEVAPSANVRAYFNHDMRASTVTSSTFKIRKQGTTTWLGATRSVNNSISPTSTNGGSQSVATLNPDANLALNTTYQVVIVGGSSGVKDTNGMALSTNKSWTFTTATPPETTIDSGPRGTVASDSASFSFSSSKSGSTFQCSLDGSAFAGCTSPQGYSSLSQGSHTFRVRAIDATGNVDPTPASRRWTVDTVAPAAPTVHLNANSNSGSQNDNITNDNTPTIGGTAEAGSTVSVLVDGVQKGSGTATGGSYSVTTSTLNDGPRSIKVTATDAAGNTSVDSDALSVTIDTQAPDTPPKVNLTTASDTGASSTDNVTSDNTPTFDVSAAAGSLVKVFRSNDPAALGSALANGNVDPDHSGNKFARVTSSQLSDGTYTIAATATDLAGNESASSATISVTLGVTVDTVAPNAPTGLDLDAASDSGSSQNDEITNDATPTINGSAQANSTVELFDGNTPVGTTQASGQGAWSITSSQLSDGTHSLTAKATDAAGNTSDASSALSVAIDTAIATPAAPDLVAASDSGSYPTDNITNDNTPTIGGAAEAGSTVSVLVDGVQKGSGTATGGSYSVTTSTLDDGTYSVTVKATDVAGNVSVPSDAVGVTVDTRAPGAPLNVDLVASSDTGASQTDNITQDQTPTFEISAEADSLVEIYKGNDTNALGGAPANGNIDPNNTNNKFALVTSDTVLAEGTYTISAKSTDAAGNVSAASATINVTVDLTDDNVAPAKPGLPDLDVNSDTGISNTDNLTNDNTPTIGGTAEAGSTVKIYSNGTLNGQVSVGASGAWSYTFFPTLQNGNYSVKVTATDAAGNTSVDSDSLSLTIDTVAPAINSVSPGHKAMRVAPNTNVTVTFSEALNSSTISGQTFSMTVAGSRVSAQVTYNASSRTATLDPAQDLDAATSYDPQITSSRSTPVKDLAGNEMVEGTIWWRFTTESNVSAVTARPTPLNLSPDPLWCSRGEDLTVLNNSPSAVTFASVSITGPDAKYFSSGSQSYLAANEPFTVAAGNLFWDQVVFVPEDTPEGRQRRYDATLTYKDATGATIGNPVALTATTSCLNFG